MITVMVMKKKYELTAPEVLEKEILERFPDLDDLTSRMLGAKEEMGWPDWCYLPMSASHAIATGGAERRIAMNILQIDRLETYRRLATVIPWRLHKIVCKFDEELAKELTDKDAEPQDIPVELLHHMPWPCVYIPDPPNMPEAAGVFFFLEWDERYPTATELRIHYLFKSGKMIATYLHWDHDREGLMERMAHNDEVLAREKSKITYDAEMDRLCALCLQHVREHLNLLVYLCSEEPDFERSQPIPRKRGRGAVKSASYPDRIEVGTRIGSAIRKSRQQRYLYDDSEHGSTRHNRPHVRRAHWHLYWTGSGRAIPKVKWVSAIFVNASDGEPTTTIRPVK